MQKILLFTIMLITVYGLSAYGQEDGIQKEYYANGAVQFERIYKDGKKEGAVWSRFGLNLENIL